MAEFTAADLVVVIPTHGRLDILHRTLAALGQQTAGGFETVVVVDGIDQPVPDEPGIRVVVKDHGGPGAARNFGTRSSDRALVLFLGDDMVPDPSLVEHHIARHNEHPEVPVAILGKVEWHPESEGGRLLRWLDWSGSQFDYGLIHGEEAGTGRFFSCNVSLKRRFFLEAGGFDEDFVMYYEDLDCSYRLEERGMRLLYAPEASVRHLHSYDWAAVLRRFEGIAQGERLMQAKHPGFSPWFAQRMRWAEDARPRSLAWTYLADRTPARPGWVRQRAQQAAETAYYQRLAPVFFHAWEGEQGIEELKQYLGDAFDQQRLWRSQEEVEAEEEQAADEATFYRTSESYLYDLTAFATWPTKIPYLADLWRFVVPGARVLDYGCGIGSDGLRLLSSGYNVGFADFDNPSTRYLRWRLERRGLTAEIFDIDRGVPGGWDAAYSFDVIEHVDRPFEFLAELESRARVVAVNFLEPDPADVHLHKPLPIARLLDHAAKRGLLRYRLYHGRSHLVVYQTGHVSPKLRLRSHAQRRLGPRLASLN